MTRYLITGGAGFIGSHLCEALLNAGHQVWAIDDLSTGRRENVAHLLKHPGFSLIVDDIRNLDTLERLARECEVVVHLAAVVGVDKVLNEPVRTLSTNLGGTEAVLEVAREHGLKTLIASTSEVYGKGARVPFGEDDDVLLGPTSKHRWAYAASKMVDEFMGLAYHREYGLPVVIFRLFNTVGPRQTERYGMVLPRFVGAALRNKPLRVFGNGTQSRCFMHVQDAVRAIIALADAPQATGRVFNVGSNEEISILGLARRVIKLTDSASAIELVPYAQAYPDGYEDMPRRVPDTSRIRETVGWTPRRSLDEIISDVAESLKFHLEPALPSGLDHGRDVVGMA